MTNEKHTPHNVTIVNRRQIRLTGITEVEAFNSEIILLRTSMGELTVSGENLNITKLATEAGDMDIEGTLISMAYSDDTHSGKGKGKGGLFSGLFK